MFGVVVVVVGVGAVVVWVLMTVFVCVGVVTVVVFTGAVVVCVFVTVLAGAVAVFVVVVEPGVAAAAVADLVCVDAVAAWLWAGWVALFASFAVDSVLSAAALVA